MMRCSMGWESLWIPGPFRSETVLFLGSVSFRAELNGSRTLQRD